MRFISFLLLLVGCGLGSAGMLTVRADGGGTRAGVDPVFAGEPRFQRQVDLSARDEALEDLLPRLGKELGVSLKTTRDTRDLKVTVFYRRAAAAAILTTLARHLDLDWNQRGGAYELIQSLKAKQREADARDTEAAEAWEYAIGVLRQAPAFAALPDDVKQREAQEIRALSQPSANLPPDQRLLVRRRMLRLIDLSNPRTLIVSRVIQRLSAAQLQSLRNGAALMLNSTDGLVPADVAEALKEHFDRSRGQGGGLGATPSPPPISGYEYSIELEFGRLEISFLPLSAGGSAHYPPRLQVRILQQVFREGKQSERRNMNWQPTEPGEAPMDAAPEPPAPNGELQQAIEFPPSVPTAPAVRENTRFVPLSTVLSALRPQIRQQILASSFVRLRLKESEPARHRTLGALLRHLKTLGVVWELNDSTLTLSTASWAVDRAEEVPNRLLRPLRELRDLSPLVVLDHYASMTRELDAERLKGLQLFWRAYFEGTSADLPAFGAGIYDQRLDIRLWSALTMGQRRALLAGDEIDERRMTPVVRQLWLSAVASPGRFQGRSPAGPKPFSPVSGGMRLRATLTPGALRYVARASGGASYGIIDQVNRVEEPNPRSPGDVEILVPLVRFRLEYRTPEVDGPVRRAEIHLPRAPEARTPPSR